MAVTTEPSDFLKGVITNAKRLGDLIATDTKAIPELSSQMAVKSAGYEAEATRLYNLERMSNKSLPEKIEKNELEKRTLAMLDADKKSTASMLQSVGRGQGDVNIKEMLGVVSEMKSASDTFRSGGILGLILAIPRLLENSWIGERVNALMMMWKGDEDGTKPKDFTEALDRVRFTKGVKEFAAKTGISEETLRKELLKPPAPPVNDNAAAKPTGEEQLGALTPTPVLAGKGVGQGATGRGAGTGQGATP